MMVGSGGWWLKLSGQESGDGNTADSQQGTKEESEETPQTSGDVQMSKLNYPELCTTYILF